MAVRSRRDPISFAVFGSHGKDEPSSAAFFASSSERREGVSIGRLTLAGSGPAGFEFDNSAGTAFVHPPAPFGGSARYLRRPGAPDSWRGSLTAPLLGLGRVHLAGPGFVAKMVPQLPNIE